MNTGVRFAITATALIVACALVTTNALAQDDDSTRNVLKQGLLGAGTGAIAASASGGNAGKGALIGAGTNVIGSALLDALTTPSSSSSSRRRSGSYSQQDQYYYPDEPEEYYYEEEAPQESSSQKVLKQGLLGAGTGAIAAGASGGNAGTGALIGAGTNVVGNALLDTLTQPSQQRRGRVYRRVPAQQQPRPQAQQVQMATQTTEEQQGKKKVIKKYDDAGKLVSEEEIYY